MFEWLHLAIAVIALLAGGLGGLVARVWQVAQIEGRLKLHIKTCISDCEKRFEEKVARATDAFDETLKALRQKINDVELDMVKHFVAKGDFDDFRAEYREDMRDLKNSIAQIPRSH